MDKASQVVTIFKDVMIPDFVIRLKEDKEQNTGSSHTLPGSPLRQEYFYMMLSSKSDKLNKFWLQIVDGKIYMCNSEESPLLAYIDISYARIKLLKQVEVAGKVLNGIRFIKNKNYEEIFHTDMNTVNDWFEALKRYCVLSKFREVYLIKNVIGKGNFAKVYISSRVTDNKDYAAKIFDKKLILQDKFERVAFERLRNALCTSSR